MFPPVVYESKLSNNHKRPKGTLKRQSKHGKSDQDFLPTPLKVTLNNEIDPNTDQSVWTGIDRDISHSEQPIKRRKLVFPWENVAEFKEVYNWLFGDSADNKSRQLGLSQLRVWHVRRGSLCPAAVLATNVIFEVLLKDSQKNSYTQSDLQTFYAFAFIRFFNYMSSTMQTHNMRTMYETAAQLGLDSFVVDLRHICSHGQVLPELTTLRNTAEYCINWLHEYYWKKQSDVMCNVDSSQLRKSDKTELDQRLTNWFGIYDTALECYLKGAQNMKSAKRHVHKNRFVKMKEYYQEHNLQTLRETFDTVVKDLNTLVKREIAIKDLTEIFIEAVLKMNYFFTFGGKQLSLEESEKIVDATQSLFRMLAVHGFIEDLFISLLLRLTEDRGLDSSRLAGISFWCIKIVAGFVAFQKCNQMYSAELDKNNKSKRNELLDLNSENLSKRARKLLIDCGVNTEQTLIFGNTLRRPWAWVFKRRFIQQHFIQANLYTAPILKALLPLVDPALSAVAMNSLSELCNTFQRTNGESKEYEKVVKQKDQTIYTVEDLYKRLKQHDADLNIGEEEIGNSNRKRTKYGIWTISPDDETIDWASCPLGKLPWEL